MARWAVLVTLLFALSYVSPGSAGSVKVETAVVTPKVILEPPSPPPPAHAAPSPSAPAVSPRARREVRKHRTRLFVSRHVPRPLSPGEFGRTRPGW